MHPVEILVKKERQNSSLWHVPCTYGSINRHWRETRTKIVFSRRVKNSKYCNTFLSPEAIKNNNTFLQDMSFIAMDGKEPEQDRK
jgi:hypothetical protein